jgi:protein SCO1/2
MNRLKGHSLNAGARLGAALFVALLCLSPAGLDLRAQTVRAAPPAVQSEPKPDAKAPHAPAIPDVSALDQNGRPLRFYSDLIKGRAVMLNFIFTSCTYVCPLQGANFSKLQAALGDRLGKDVSLISVSIDPLTDTPRRLKSWGAKFGARPGWTLVTGSKAEMDRLLRALTGDPSGVSEHSSVVFIGDYDRGVWVRADGLDDPARLIQTLDTTLRK